MVNYTSLHSALQDPGLRFKYLSTKDYMTTLSNMKKLLTHFNEINADIASLSAEYNKEYNDRVKKIREKEKDIKGKGIKETPSAEDIAFLETKPPVTSSQNGTLLHGPFDFIEKVNKINERSLKGLSLNYIRDEEAFKQVVEGADPQNQLVLYEKLFTSK